MTTAQDGFEQRGAGHEVYVVRPRLRLQLRRGNRIKEKLFFCEIHDLAVTIALSDAVVGKYIVDQFGVFQIL